MQQQMPNKFATQMRSPTGYSRDLTDLDLSSHLRSVSSTGGLIVKFYYVKVRIQNVDAEVNGEVQTRLCVSKQPKGDRSTVAVRFITEEQALQQFPREWAMFKQYEEVPTDGTPLDELPGITLSQIGMLVINGLRSVEDIADLSDDAAGQIGLEATRTQKLAREWLAKRDESSDTIDHAEEASRYQIENTALSKRLEELEASNKALTAQNQALQTLGGQNVAQQPGTGAAMNAIPTEASDGGEDLPYKVEEMDDPMSEGPATTDGDDDLRSVDPDPLAGEG